MSHTIFLTILNMGLTATYVALAVIVLRLALRKAPKWLICALWALVGLRLICPFSFKSMFSLIPSSKPIPTDIGLSATPAIESGVPIINQSVNPILTQTMTPNPSVSINPMQVVIEIGCWIWLVGILVMLIYAVGSTWRLRRRTRESLGLSKRVYLCDRIDTPFILGIVRPKIFLPSHLSQEVWQSVIAHETAHLKRWDHLWKPLGFALLSVYWFNPVLWIGYVLLCKDIEFACDEKVIRAMEPTQVKQYSTALLHLSTGHHLIAACPLAFGEVGVKGRIKAILNYKKPAFWLMITALVVSITLAVCFLTDPLGYKAPPSSETDLPIQGTATVQGVSFTLTAFDPKENTLSVTWQNDTPHEIWVRVNDYELCELEDGRVTSIVRNPRQDNTIEVVDTGLSFTQKCSLDGMIWSEGAYRFRGNFMFVVDNGNAGDLASSYVDFSVTSKQEAAYQETHVPTGQGLENITVTDSATDLDGVSLAINKVDFTATVPSITIAWNNKSAKQLSLSEEFYIYRLTKDGKTDIRKNPEDYVWNLTAFLIDSRKTSYKEYSLYDMDWSAGTYRFETKFSHTDDVGWGGSPTYTAFIEFTVSDDALSSIGGADPPADITVNANNRVLFRVGESPETAPFMDGSHISQITKGIENDDEVIRIDLTANGTVLFAKATNENAGQIISLWVDGTLFVSATVPMPITDGTLLLHGSLLTDQQLDLLMTLAAQNNANPYFEGVVKETLDNAVLVEVTDQGVSGLSGEVYVSLTSLAQGTWPNLQAGETVRVIYNGQIQETFPPQVYAIYVFNDPNQTPAIEADLGDAHWDFVLVGTATDYSANNIGKLFDDQRASHDR